MLARLPYAIGKFAGTVEPQIAGLEIRGPLVKHPVSFR
jgi:hypothetical protein